MADDAPEVKPRRGRPRAEDRPEGDTLRDRVMREASVLFRQKGAAGTTIAEIARQSGVTAPALYWHFSSKDELLRELLDETWRGFNETLADALRWDLAPAERLRALVVAHTRWRLAEVEMPSGLAFVQLVESLPPEMSADLRAGLREYVAQISAILESGRRSGEMQFEDLRTTTRAVLNICLHSARSGEHPPEKIAQLNGDLVLAMVGAR
ncbi:TetR/AcrR family transcriptional regulator [Aeromicrobium choanae]|uniref:Transcriptional regulator, TetR family n=1 Tax=Aeromicrobium choanae TaxID=1736691 RepID=A0A1T4YYK7_9ACTN|nr:TetR/AcrR family transcriptional regulator [Aeromicrobium choanae]SKB06401.1 transcriptional regulator, TetR family [Aeromicrobium choanae]